MLSALIELRKTKLNAEMTNVFVYLGYLISILKVTVCETSLLSTEFFFLNPPNSSA